MSFSQLDEDQYKPPTPKNSLQQYDNYQIYSLFCTDITSNTEKNVTVPYVQTTNTLNTVKMKSFVAVQKYSPYRKIPCDFDALIIAHP